MRSSFAERASTTSRTSTSRSPATGWWSSPASRARASRRSPSTPSSPRASGATSSRSRPMPGSSCRRSRSRTSTPSTASRPPSRSSRSRCRGIPRSTVGTVTEIQDYLRLLFASIGIPHCPSCGQEIRPQTVQQMVDRLSAACPRAPGSSSTRPTCAARRASTGSSSPRWRGRDFCARASTARRSTCRRRSRRSTSRRSTRSTSSSTGWW